MTTLDRQHFRISVDSDGHVLTLRLAGEVDLASARTLRACLMDGLASETIVDLSAVSFMDSSAVKVLVLAHQQAAEERRTLTVRRPSRAAAHVLRLTGADEVLTIV